MKKFIILGIVIMSAVLVFLYSYVAIHKVHVGDIPILTYHSIEDKDGQYIVKDKTFEKMIKTLKDEGFNFLNAQDLLKIKENKMDLPKKPVMITLDDGYKNNYTNAYPILKKYDAKATIFVIGSYVSNHDEFLTWDMIEEMSGSGLIDIESHTFNSHALRADGKNKGKTFLSTKTEGESDEDYYDRIYNDLVWNNNLLYSHTSIFPVSIAYPGAMANDIVKRAVKDAGLKLGFVGANKTASSIEKMDPYKINRFNIKESTDIENFVKIITPSEK